LTAGDTVPSRLDVFADGLHFVVAWDDEGYPGLRLGERWKRGVDHTAASEAARELNIHVFHARGTLRFGTISDARKALRAARAAIRALKPAKPPRRKKTPAWPSWAIQAKSAGWKPPKGWRP
jgi:hypothetical protein